MPDEFNLFSVYEQNLNFLIGAGASHGFLPTLALKIKDIDASNFTFETLAKKYEDNEHIRTLLFMLYYEECIKPGIPKKTYKNLPDLPKLPVEKQKDSVIVEYKRFITTLIRILDRQKQEAKKANIFTTNYDNCFETASEELLGERSAQFVINDGSAGFQRKSFHTRNFNNRVVNRGVFDRYDQYLPQINILHAHGSVHWGKGKRTGEIELNYGPSDYGIEFSAREKELINTFKAIIYNENSTANDVQNFQQDHDLTPIRTEDFWRNYNNIPIVNPTKWKFHETVFEDAYYQILRHLSYELERQNSVLITFGFSFADEHILNLVQRSLSNPSLTVYISCFNAKELEWMKEVFKEYPNVKFIYLDEDSLNFKQFNDIKFTLNCSSDKKNDDVNQNKNVIIGGQV